MGEAKSAGSGAGIFFLGMVMAATGLYLVSRTVILHTGFFSYFWGIPFGLTLLPLLVGVGWLFYDDRSFAAWGLSIVGLAIILAEILKSIDMAIKPITLYEGFVMFGLIAGGVGLMLRGGRRLRAVTRAAEPGSGPGAGAPGA